MSGQEPDALANMPKLLFHQGYYFDIFQTLDLWREHTENGEPKPLTLAQVLTYCEMFEIRSRDVRATLISHLKRMDISLLVKRAAKRKSDTASKDDVS